jgi:hypothetical protein
MCFSIFFNFPVFGCSGPSSLRTSFDVTSDWLLYFVAESHSTMSYDGDDDRFADDAENELITADDVEQVIELGDDGVCSMY